MIHHGDCLEVMAGLGPESVDAIVTDPPYGLEFMGKEWDRLDAGLPQERVWKGRRGKGGAGFADEPTVAFKGTVRGPSFGGGKHGFKRCTTCGKRAFSGSPCQCPDPTWVVEYAQSAPSSAIRMQRWHEAWAREAYRVAKPSAYLLAFGGTRTVHRLASAIEDAGWIIRDLLVWGYASGFPKSKASLKPAWEPIVMARKPGPLRELAIDECRIPLTGDEAADDREGEATADTRYGDKVRAKPGRRLIMSKNEPSLNAYGDGLNGSRAAGSTTLGRWPANIVLTDPIFDGDVPGVVGGGETASGKMMPTPVRSGDRTVFGADAVAGYTTIETYGDSGTYSRFFLIPKADRADREPVLAPTMGNGIGAREHDPANPRAYRRNVHPTVKPTDLMRHLVRLVTPPGGTVLDPFLGSGTTGIACELEGFPWIGIEREAEYVAIAEARLNGTQRGLGLTG